MNFGQAIGTACSTFAITNIDDIFVLVTFFAEAANPETQITSLKICLGQYLGFSIIVMVSMIGYAVAMVLPAEPIGFLGLLPILLGIWKGLHLLFPGYKKEEEGVIAGRDLLEVEGDMDARSRWQQFRKSGLKPIFSVAAVTIMNGGDNIGTYIPLFSQAKGAGIAVYVVVSYILLGIWILAAWLIMKQKHILKIAEEWAEYVVPFLYVGLGIFIVVKSECYPWSIEEIDKTVEARPGTISMGVSTAALLVVCISVMIWFHWNKSRQNGEASAEEEVRAGIREGHPDEQQSREMKLAADTPIEPAIELPDYSLRPTHTQNPGREPDDIQKRS